MEKIEVKLECNQKELIILQGKALEPKAPINISITGNIDSPRLFLEKRVSELEQKQCHILVNRENLCMLLNINETDSFNNGLIEGKIELSEEFKQFKINTGSTWSPFDLADFIKMNRSYFESKDVAAKLVSTLRDFKAKIDREVEMSKDDKANYNVKRSQAVKSNLPDTFTLNVRIFKGKCRISIPVEINIHPETLNCILISPDASDYVKEQTDMIFNEEIEEIITIAKDIVIIEQ